MALSQDPVWMPARVSNNQVVHYPMFSFSYNETHEQPDWVAYELTKEEVEASGDRCQGCFFTDDRVSTGSATPEDYTSTGFDKGHLAPSADNLVSEEMNR